MKDITIAIDGFSSCGKSTIAKNLATRIGYTYIDTGAMYRALTLYTMENGLWLDDTTPDRDAIAKHLNKINIRLKGDDIYLNERNVSKEIRSMQVSNHVSPISTIDIVREKLTTEQQKIGQHGAVVMDGRDIGTNVFPNAELKIFLTADPNIRAQRRLQELRDKGDLNTSFEDVFSNLTERDRIDSTRAIAPLKQADDAIVIDNSHLTKLEQDEKLLQLFNNALNNSNQNTHNEQKSTNNRNR